MLKQIKIPDVLLSHLLKQGQVRNSYQTNRALKIYGVYFILKSVTSSGKLHNFSEQVDELAKLCKISRSNFYSKINELQKLGLVTRTNSSLHLSSWEKCLESCDFDPKVFYDFEFYTISYDTSRLAENQTIDYLIRGLEISVNQHSQAFGYASKLRKNPHVLMYTELLAEPKSLNGHENALRKSFTNGASEMTIDALNAANPNLNRNSASIREAQGYRCRLQVTYMKRQLELRGIATIEKPKTAVYEYSQESLSKTSEGLRVAASPCFYRNYNRAAKTAVMAMPDKVLFIKQFFGGFKA